MIEITAPCCGQKILFTPYEFRAGDSLTFACPDCDACIEVIRTNEGLEVELIAPKWKYR